MIYLLAWPGLLFLVLVVLLIASFDLGAWIGGRAGSGGAETRHAALDGVMFALLGLLLAFSFSAAAGRFEARAAQVVQEANAIGTAILRLSILPQDAQPALREKFRRYVDARMMVNEKVADPAAFLAAMREASALQNEIWALVVAAGRRPDVDPSVNVLLLPALNDMMDVTTTRAMATQMHTPVPILGALVVLAMVCTAVIGHGSAASPRPNRFRLWSYCVVVALALYICIDLEYPRHGLIRLTEFEKSLISLLRR